MALADAVDLSSLALEDHNENGDTARRRQEEPREESPGHGEESSHDAQLRESLQLMRSYLQTADPPCQEINDATLERFLVTNAMDPKKASDFLLEFFKWRRTFAPLGYIPEDEIVNERKKGKLCLQGYDKKGRLVGVFLVVRHDAFDRDLEEFKRYIVYAFDKAISSTKNKLKQLVVIVDLAGWGYRSVDVRGYLALLDILQEHYLNHLGKMILIHVPVIFWAAWKVTSPFFDEFTKERMMFVEDKNLNSVLLEEIDEDQLPDIYGGKLPLEPV